MSNRILQPALLGGLAIGVLSGLPFVNVGNCCCCLWVVGGGMLTVYLLGRQAEVVETGDAVLAGLLAGLIGGVISGVIGLAFAEVLRPYTQNIVERALDMLPNVPPETRQQIEEAMQNRRAWQGVARIYSVILTTAIYMVVSMLGALLGTALFRKKAPVVPQG